MAVDVLAKRCLLGRNKFFERCMCLPLRVIDCSYCFGTNPGVRRSSEQLYLEQLYGGGYILYHSGKVHVIPIHSVQETRLTRRVCFGQTRACWTGSLTFNMALADSAQA
jgi:hypothetical protein